MHADGQRLRNLHGCVNDAKDVALFIHEQYNVPQSQITLLLNEQATRVNIKRYIQDFITLPQYAMNDAFVIFVRFKYLASGALHLSTISLQGTAHR